MNKNVSILFALMVMLLVAALFEGEGALPAMADAAKLARADTQAQVSEADSASATSLDGQGSAAPSALTLNRPPAPP
ncbi:MAG: hypothetical protein B7X92_02180, partial [Novosphingobium sp. 17-62-9]